MKFNSIAQKSFQCHKYTKKHNEDKTWTPFQKVYEVRGSLVQSIIKPLTSNLKPKSQVEVHSSVKQQI